MNLTLSITSCLSGVAMIVAGIIFKDIAAGFNGIGAVTISVVLYQLSDVKKEFKELKERMTRLEDFIFDQAKANREGL